MKLISWTGWTKDDWKAFLQEVENMGLWVAFALVIFLFMVVG